MNEWFVGSLGLLIIWFVVFIFRKDVRREMFWVSLFTMPLGLAEPLFVPAYWNPSSLFNLASRIGFDIESLIFSFAMGGLGAVLYELFFRVKHLKMSKHERNKRKHSFHLLALFSPVIVFILLYLLTNLNPIYSVSIAMFIGGIFAVLCRPDLKKKVFIGGAIFLVLYFVFFLFFNLIYPYAVEEFWNLSAVSGILVLGIPIEELMFAFSFGMLWSSIYEHVGWYKLRYERTEK